jgi:DNA mismatch repair ATPase MutS
MVFVIILILVAAVAVVNLVRRRRQQAGELRKLRLHWGQAKIPPEKSELDRIALYDRLKYRAAANGLDDKTWSDLNLDLVFEYIDRTSSRMGQQFLFSMLRNPQLTEDPLLQFEKVINSFSNANLRESLQLELRRLRHKDALFLPYLFLEDLPSFRQRRFVFLALSLVTLASLAGAIFFTSFRVIAALLVITNMCVSLYYRRQLEVFIQPLRLLNQLIHTAHRIADKLAGSEISDQTETLKDKVKQLSGVQRKTTVLSFDRESDELTSTVYSYLNMVFLLDLNCFAFAVEELENKRADVAAIFEGVGYLDAAISTASVRHGNPDFTTPFFVSRRKACRFTQLYHPLLESPVPNDLTVNGKGILLTGSNMSGKSTFIRTVGVNAVLAQTIHSCFAHEYRAPFLDVRACMGASDSLVEGRSYYFAEVENVLALVTAAQSGRQCLFLIDELFRGTNTMERVAAAKAILEYINRGDHIVMIATHDIELAELLDQQYVSNHFREIIHDQQMSFDYKLQAGTSSTRNAIAILDMSGYPRPIIDEALTTVDQLAQNKSKPRKHWFFG